MRLADYALCLLHHLILPEETQVSLYNSNHFGANFNGAKQGEGGQYHRVLQEKAGEATHEVGVAGIWLDSYCI